MSTKEWVIGEYIPLDIDEVEFVNDFEIAVDTDMIIDETPTAEYPCVRRGAMIFDYPPDKD